MGFQFTWSINRLQYFKIIITSIEGKWKSPLLFKNDIIIIEKNSFFYLCIYIHIYCDVGLNISSFQSQLQIMMHFSPYNEDKRPQRYIGITHFFKSR